MFLVFKGNKFEHTCNKSLDFITKHYTYNITTAICPFCGEKIMESPLKKLVEAHKNLAICHSNANWDSDANIRLEGRPDGNINIKCDDSWITVNEQQADVIINGLNYLLGRDEK